MAELLFVGLGLGDEQDLTLRELELLRSTERLFVEQYTSRWSDGALDRLEKLLGRRPQEVGREEVEAERPVLQALSEAPRVAFLVVGEPFAATTHVSLRLAAERAGHSWRVLHNASILTAAAGLAGLSHYKFGRIISLPRPTPEFRPTSPYESLAANWKAGLHSLVLLDLSPPGGPCLEAPEALRILGELESERKEGAFPPERRVVVVERAGTPSATVSVGTRSELEQRTFGPPLHCLIVPGPTLHFVEEEALAAWAHPRRPAPSVARTKGKGSGG